jgi:hypothetical protein
MARFGGLFLKRDLQSFLLGLHTPGKTQRTVPYIHPVQSFVTGPLVHSFYLVIWIALGAIAGALVASIRCLEDSVSTGWISLRIEIMAFVATGALVGSAIYLTLAETLYQGLFFLF